MNCPRCNAPGAYVGLNVVECSNERCEHFKAPERSPALASEQEEFKRIVDQWCRDLRIDDVFYP